MISLRSPPPPASPPPSPRLTSRQAVRIRHPAYNSSKDILLSLPSADCYAASDADVSYGVHFRTVHTACAIIADNRFDGWIAADVHGQAKIELADSDLLPSGDYWFHVPVPDVAADNSSMQSTTSPPPYPIVPNFRAYKFPDHIPSSFKQSVAEPDYTPPGSMPPVAAVRQRDVSCRLTGHTDAVERAHVIPASEKDWFGGNNMARYAPTYSGRDAIDSEFNAILLRQDVHTLWDKMQFSIVPKRRADGEWVLVAHVHNNVSLSVHRNYHNTHLHPVRGVSPEYLFARFAWDIFPHLHSFLQGKKSRCLTVLQESGEMKVQQLTGNECARMCEGQGLGRSTTPSKRKRGNAEPKNAEGDFDLESSAISLDSGISGVAAEEKLEWSATDESAMFDENWGSPSGRAKKDELLLEAEQEIAEQEERRAKYIQEWEEEEAEWRQGVADTDLHRGRKRKRLCER